MLPVRLTRALRWLRWRLAALWLALFAVSLLALVYWPINRAACLAVRPSGEMLDRRGRPLYVFLNDRQQWCFVRELPEVSPYLIQATLAAEDQRFYYHFGLDPLAVGRAVLQNLRHRRVVSGASTLTMQVIKQTGRPSASLWGKLRQAVLAVQLERRASKAEILRAYLNTAPYGLNLVGCEAAARRYYGKSARELTLAEAALLAGLPQSPTTCMPLKSPSAARRRRDYVLARLRREGAIGEAEYRRARAEPPGVGWHAFPQLAPHLAQRLQPLAATQGRVATALDAATQQSAETLVRDYVKDLKKQPERGHIGNAALLVIDVPAAAVLAEIGGADFFNKPDAGQVDATRAARSPGSALKPFTYALALERGCLYPTETLLDDSLDYGLYSPENMDRRFHGLIAADEALRRSLNVPAVTVLGRLGVGGLYQFLRGLDFTTLERPAEYYGLGLTLGSCEVRLEELAAAYVMLANLGRYRPLQLVRPSPGRHARRGLSAATCLMLYEMLEQPLPRELDRESAAGAIGLAPRVCWKTGTSWGNHDAWAIVFNRQYLVAAWLGNNDGKSAPGLIGAQAALPLAASVFRRLPPTTAPAWPNPAGALREVKVCAVSGLPASAWCPRTRAAWLPGEQFISRICDMHYPLTAPAPSTVGTTNTTGTVGTTGTLAADLLTTRGPVGERWPGSAKAWDLARITDARAPVRRLSIEAGRLDALSIRTPASRAEFILTGAPDGDRIRLATSLDEQTPVHWYLDDRFLGTAQPRQPLMLPLTPGAHKLVCMTPSGLSDQVRFAVIDPSQ